MRLVPLIVPMVIALAAVWRLSPATSQEPPQETRNISRLDRADAVSGNSDVRIAALVKQLGSQSYQDRLVAARDLSAIGPNSRKALEAAAAAGDAEIRLQA